MRAIAICADKCRRESSTRKMRVILYDVAKLDSKDFTGKADKRVWVGGFGRGRAPSGTQVSILVGLIEQFNTGDLIFLC